ncbi:hypothetical protein [Streptomyces sp. NBC_01373]|uniref:hypothetical protein n=1 Tax=Streptomyces sp. NBC_01373 TaxID=2903843 RepID=UPI00224FB016|nr:hypothetical protein [Streptomyces sp. NBC_01373]MCX4699541.1 hypothetical protein [Streptomyces sp. NBC_01373]
MAGRSAERERIAALRALIAWLLRRYGGLGIADIVRVAEKEGIPTTWAEVADLKNRR